MKQNPSYLTGGRRIPRPTSVQICPACRDALGANYATCQVCHTAIEEIWLADWQALLEIEQIPPGSPQEMILAHVVMAETERHPWTVVDVAMSKLRCSECGRELGEGYGDCGECGMAFGAAIVSEFNATGNEHALHVGRWILRFPHRNSADIVKAWRLSMPRLLTGWLPTTDGAQHMMAFIKAGNMHVVEESIKSIDREINGERPQA